MALSSLWNRNDNNPDFDDNNARRDILYTSLALIPLLFFATLFVLAHLRTYDSLTTALLWAFACLVSGIAIGFLFGIPKVLQKDETAPAKQGSGSQQAEAANEVPTKSAEVYRQRVNTNLTEISDWLTKIIVGLGLVNLHKLPPKVGSLADILAGGLNSTQPANEKGFAVALIVGFSTLGFLFGYLYTRLFLAGAFARADQGPGAEIGAILNRQSAGVPDRPPSSPRGGEPTEAQLVDAAKVEQLVSPSDLSMIKQQLVSLAREYERIRSVMPSGAERTHKMEIVVAKMRTLALAGYSFLAEFAASQSPGERLVAVAMLQIRPNAEYLRWLAQRFAEETPFITYHAGVALLKAVQTLGQSSREYLQRALEEARAIAGNKLQDSDIADVLDAAEKEFISKG